MAIAWTLRFETITSAVIGASKLSHVEDAVGSLSRLDFSSDELQRIDKILAGHS
jgi:L-glyceraldehyde 3-phosphate reductase